MSSPPARPVNRRGGLRRLYLVRSWLIVLLAVIAAITAWVATGGKEAEYQAQIDFVLRPAANLPDDQVADAIRNLSDNSGELRTTVANVLSSGRFIDLAAEQATGQPAGPDYTLGVSVASDSDILTMDVRGPERSTVDEIARAIPAVSSDWIRGVYRVYELELLATDFPEEPIASSTTRVVVLAAVLGALLGVGVIYAEWIARGRGGPSRDMPVEEPSTVHDMGARRDSGERSFGVDGEDARDQEDEPRPRRVRLSRPREGP